MPLGKHRKLDMKPLLDLGPLILIVDPASGSDRIRQNDITNIYRIAVVDLHFLILIPGKQPDKDSGDQEQDKYGGVADQNPSTGYSGPR